MFMYQRIKIPLPLTLTISQLIFLTFPCSPIPQYRSFSCEMDNLKGKELKSSHWEGRLEVLLLSRMHTQVKTSVVPWEMECPDSYL